MREEIINDVIENVVTKLAGDVAPYILDTIQAEGARGDVGDLVDQAMDVAEKKFGGVGEKRDQIVDEVSVVVRLNLVDHAIASAS